MHRKELDNIRSKLVTIKNNNKLLLTYLNLPKNKGYAPIPKNQSQYPQSQENCSATHL
jgi:hypothetical protein